MDCITILNIMYAVLYQYIVERHADTLLPQYLGMYRVTLNDTESYHLIMRYVFSPRLTVHKKYNLKVLSH